MVRPPGLTVPGNEWDRFHGMRPDPLPRVSVIVVHFEQQGELDRTLHALARQSYPAEMLEVIVVDDGSAVPPRVPVGVTLVRQDDRGFRLAAARNLGVAHSTGSVICFIDADTTPEPGYVDAIIRLPAIAPETVAVGRRRHADFAGIDVRVPVEVAAAQNPLSDPEWLSEAYAHSRDLLDADDRSYRFVIGAVIACSRWFLDEVGGFDETFETYGGEDWDWAYRAWLAGAILAHVPEAVAWHDGPDWGGRALSTAEVVGAKNGETLALAERIPAPGGAPRALVSERADVVVHVDVDGPAAALVATVDALLAALPRAHIVVADAFARHFPVDHRVIGATEAAASAAAPRFARARIALRLHRLAIVDAAALVALVDGLTISGGSRVVSHSGVTLLTAEHSRARIRRERWGREDLFETRRETLAPIIPLDERSSLAAYFGGWLR